MMLLLPPLVVEAREQLLEVLAKYLAKSQMVERKWPRQKLRTKLELDIYCSASWWKRKESEGYFMQHDDTWLLLFLPSCCALSLHLSAFCFRFWLLPCCGPFVLTKHRLWSFTLPPYWIFQLSKYFLLPPSYILMEWIWRGRTRLVAINPIP